MNRPSKIIVLTIVSALALLAAWAKLKLVQATSAQIPASEDVLLLVGGEGEGGRPAAPTNPYTLLDQVIASGGTAAGGLTSTNYQMQGTVGQPAHVVPTSSDNYVIDSGYWGGFSSEERWPGALYLPAVLRDHLACFTGPEEVEPNNSYDAANGPLCSGFTYTGRPDDVNDWFSFHLNHDGLISIELTGIQASEGVQLQLHYDQYPNVVYYIPDPGPYTLDYQGAAGWYYLRIYAAYPNTPEYTLTVGW